MRIGRLISLGFLALMLISCAVPGGIYKGYEGPDRDVTELAVLDWSASKSKVTHIDGKYLHEGQPSFGGVRITVAYLEPGGTKLPSPLIGKTSEATTSSYLSSFCLGIPMRSPNFLAAG